MSSLQDLSSTNPAPSHEDCPQPPTPLLQPPAISAPFVCGSPCPESRPVLSVFSENHSSFSLISSLPDHVDAPCPVVLRPLGLQSLPLWPGWHRHGLEPTSPPLLTEGPEGSGPVCAPVSWVSEGRGGAQAAPSQGEAQEQGCSYEQRESLVL